MLGRVGTIMGRLYNLPPREVVRQIRRRLGASVGETPLNPKDLRPNRPFDFLNRYERILGRVADWAPIDFRDKDVLEVGAGPLALFGPLSIFLGARSYLSIDPDSKARPFDDLRLVGAYLKPMHADLSALFGERIDLPTFIAAVRERVEVRAALLMDVRDVGSFNIVLSNSCLEHVFPLEESVAHMARLMAPEARYLHMVNFGNHLPTPSPFEGMYDMPPQAYWARNRKTINLARLGDMRRAFEMAGLEPIVAPVSVMPAEDRFPPEDQVWARRSPEDLWTRTALFAR
jgi:SAM-dependent methyltransferase